MMSMKTMMRMTLFAPDERRHRRSSGLGRQQGGFTLIEVMVSVLILLVGVLGVVGMQMLSLQTNQGAYFRSQAVFMASEILDSMRANPAGALSYVGVYPEDGGPVAVPAAPACASSSPPSTFGCSPQDAAAQNIREWSRHFADLALDPNDADADAFRPSIPGARAVITASGDEYTVRVTWNERGFDDTNADDGSTTRSRVERAVTLSAVLTP